MLAWSLDPITGTSLLSFMAMRRYTTHLPCACWIKFFLVIDGLNWFTVQPKPLRSLNGQVCEICGDEIGLTVDGEVFVACNECGFPVCRPCYEYERREGSQLCPQCKTRFKRLKGNFKKSFRINVILGACCIHLFLL